MEKKNILKFLDILPILWGKMSNNYFFLMEYPDCDFLLPDLDLLQTSGCIQQKPVIWKRDGSNACLQLQASIGKSYLMDNVVMYCTRRPEIKMYTKAWDKKLLRAVSIKLSWCFRNAAFHPGWWYEIWLGINYLDILHSQRAR